MGGASIFQTKTMKEKKTKDVSIFALRFFQKLLKLLLIDTFILAIIMCDINAHTQTEVALQQSFFFGWFLNIITQCVKYCFSYISGLYQNVTMRYVAVNVKIFHRLQRQMLVKRLVYGVRTKIQSTNFLFA